MRIGELIPCLVTTSKRVPLPSPTFTESLDLVVEILLNLRTVVDLPVMLDEEATKCFVDDAGRVPLCS
jgi:hypothetical protein